MGQPSMTCGVAKWMSPRTRIWVEGHRPEIGQEADQDHRILRARGTLPRSEEGGYQGVRGPFENKQRQIAMTLVMMVIEGEFLLAMGRILRVIEVQDNSGRGLGVTCNEVIDERRVSR